MAENLTRAHVVMPKEVVEEVDRLVGQRRRSRFMTEAVKEKLVRARLASAARLVQGSLADEETPGWETPEAASAWVRSLRRSNDQRLREAGEAE